MPSVAIRTTSPGAEASASAAACWSVRLPFWRSPAEMVIGAASRPMFPVACRVTSRPPMFGVVGGTGVLEPGESAVALTKYLSSVFVHSAFLVSSVFCWLVTV